MLDKKRLLELEEYIRRHLIIQEAAFEMKCISEDIQMVELDDFVQSNRKPSFSQLLFRFIDNEGVRDAELYKKAGLDRKHFSKIRSNPNYRSGKNTVIVLAFALQLDRAESEQLLGSAGYYLSESDTFDLIIQYFIEKKIYDIHEVNAALDYYNLKTLISEK